MALTAKSCAIGLCEPRQVRKEAALNKIPYVPQGRLARANYYGSVREGMSKAGARIFVSFMIFVFFVWKKQHEGRLVVLCAKNRCCSIWTVITVILILAAVVAAVYIVLKKLNILGYHYQPMDEGYWPEDDNPKVAESGVPYTADQDFV